MATTSLSLGPHWEPSIKAQIDSGRFATASEAIRAALRGRDEHQQRLDALRADIAIGLADAEVGRVVDQIDVDGVFDRVKARAAS